MKKNEQMKNSHEKQRKSGLKGILHSYITIIKIIHQGLGAPRIIISYVFLAFAILSFIFTIKVPVSNYFLKPTDGAKAQSRAITGVITLNNLFAYGMIMNWRRKGGTFYIAIRVAIIALAVYFDAFLVQVTYILIRDGTLL
jgi:hypothetical protein